MSILKKLENRLAVIFSYTPQLDGRTKESIVSIWPWVALIAGVLQLYAAETLWRAGHRANHFAEYVDRLGRQLYGADTHTHLGVFFYLGLVMLSLSGLLALIAYRPLLHRTKAGWRLLFVGVWLNVLYGLLLVFETDFDGTKRLLGALLGAFLAFYFLFQIRSLYKLHPDDRK